MTRSSNIRIMISSRSNQKFPYKGNANQLLAQLRKDLKTNIEQQNLLDQELFEVWINEEAPAEEGDIWDVCLSKIRKADIVIALYNGDAGWAENDGEIGICHAELLEANRTAPGKLRILQLAPLAPLRKGADGARDKRFREYVTHHHPFTGAPCRNGEEIIGLCRQTIRELVATLVHGGVREARRGTSYIGDALDWSRLDFRRRQQQMELSLVAALRDRGAVVQRNSTAAFLALEDQEVLIICSAVAGPFSVPEAREGVNHLFLRDFEHAAILDDRRVGPIHLIACQRSITEAQALRQLGFPDATVVSPPFGVFVADEIQKAQLVFMSNCRDPTSTIYQLQRVFDWLNQAGEAPLLMERATARTRIVQAIAKEHHAKVKSARG